MRELEIVKKATEILEEQGFVVWRPAKVKFAQSDIFGVFDILALKRGDAPHFIQLTTYSNASKRCRKIMKFFSDNNVSLVHAYVWAYQNIGFRRYVVLPGNYAEIK